MAIHKDFPSSPFEVLDPKTRWFPADEAFRESSYEKLPPPLVHKVREQVFAWRAGGYAAGPEH
jgi:type III restriction enzyme